MKPSKEQIEAWMHESQCIRQIGFIQREDGESPAEPWIGFVANRPQVESAVELAYAAGRKAGMEEAQNAPKPSLFDAEGSRCHHGVLTAQQCCWSCQAERDAIRAAMEADK